MAKGDDSRSRNQVEYQTNLSQNNLNNLRTDTLVPQNQEFWNQYLSSRAGDQADYGNIKGQFQNFADTGGYSDADIGNIRARAVSPYRAIYANANRDVDRARALQGGYSPGYGVLKSRMARDLSSGMSDASQNTEGMIAQLRNQGRQFGTSGLLSAYATTPAQTALASGNALSSTGQRIQGEQLQGQIGSEAMRNQIAASQLPGKYQSALSNVSGTLGTISQAAGLIYPWLGGGLGGAGTGTFGGGGYGGVGTDPNAFNPYNPTTGSGNIGYPTPPPNAVGAPTNPNAARPPSLYPTR